MKKSALVYVTALVLSPATVFASGFRIPEASIAGLGTSNALVANTKLLGALAYNPAAMSFHEGTNIVTGLLVIEPNTEVTPQGQSRTFESDPNSPFYVPNLYAMGHITSDVTWGLNVNAPFGLETHWAPNTFNFGGLAVVQPTKSKIEMVNVNPNIAYRVNKNFSIAGGVDYYYANDVDLNSVVANVSGDGSDFGWNIGALYAAGPWSVGGSYRSAVTIDLDGQYVTNSTGAVTPAEADLNLPWMAQVGVRYQMSEKLGVEFDVERTGWKKFNGLVVKNKNTGATLTSNLNGWHNSNAYRLGATYDLSTKTQLRFGYTFDETPQPDERFTARVPDADRHLFSIGVGQKLGGWTLEAGYMYVMFEDRTINNSGTFSSPTQDPNGTSVYNGEYETDIHLLGVGITKSF